MDHVPCGLLGNLWVAHTATTAIHQDEARDPLWRLAVGLEAVEDLKADLSRGLEAG